MRVYLDKRALVGYAAGDPCPARRAAYKWPEPHALDYAEYSYAPRDDSRFLLHGTSLPDTAKCGRSIHLPL